MLNPIVKVSGWQLSNLCQESFQWGLNPIRTFVGRVSVIEWCEEFPKNAINGRCNVGVVRDITICRRICKTKNEEILMTFASVRVIFVFGVKLQEVISDFAKKIDERTWWRIWKSTLKCKAMISNNVKVEIVNVNVEINS